MEGNNPASIIQCNSIVKSIALIDIYLICGLDNGALQIYTWENGKEYCTHYFYDLSSTDKVQDKLDNHPNNDLQVVHLCIIDYEEKTLVAQCRSGDLFLVKLIDKAVLLHGIIRTGIESFVKIASINHHSLTKGKLLSASSQENELLIINILEDCKDAKITALQLNPKSIQNTENNDDEDDETIMPNKSLINCLLSKKENDFIILSYESCIIQLINFEFKSITYLELSNGQIAEPIITIESFLLNSNITYICLGLFSTKGIILQYNHIKNDKLSIIKIIDNLCPELRCGISSIFFHKIIKVDLLSLDNTELKETNLLCFAGYDHRVKFFDISLNSNNNDTNSLQLTNLGNLILPNQCIINQIIISPDVNESYYLFIVSEQRLLYTYSIA